MFDYYNQWLHFEERLKSANNRYQSLKSMKSNCSDILVKSAYDAKQCLINRYVAQEHIIEYISNKYQRDINVIKSYIHPDSSLFSVESNDTYAKIDYYITIFKTIDKFLSYMNEECYYFSNVPVIQDTGIFTYDTKEVIDIRLDGVASLFSISKNEALNLARFGGFLLSVDTSKLLEKIVNLSNVLGIDSNQFIQYCKRYPRILTKHPPKFKIDIQAICEHINIGFDDYVSIIKRYPPFIRCRKTEILRLSRFGSDAIIKYPYLLNLEWNRYYINCGYSNIQDLYNILDYIQSNYGNIVDVNITFKNKIPFAYSIVDLYDSDEFAVMGLGNDINIILRYFDSRGIVNKVNTLYESYSYNNECGIIQKFRKFPSQESVDTISSTICKRYSQHQTYYDQLYDLLK